MSLGKWASDVADGDPYLMGILEDVPGEMCPRINAALPGGGSRWYRPVRLPSRKPSEPDADDYDELWSIADEAIDQRDRLIDGIEECRTALAEMREALVAACHELRARKRADEAAA